MKSVSFQLFILLVQIYLASKIEGRSSDGQEFLIETESGEVFRSQPSKKDTEEAGHDYADDYDDGEDHGPQKYGSTKDQGPKKYGSPQKYGSTKDHGPQKYGSHKDHGLTTTTTSTTTEGSTTTTTSTTTTIGRNVSDCGVRRVRKNWKNLGEDERQRLVRAMEDLISRGKYQEIANFHGAPSTICPHMPYAICCPHDNSVKTLPWHRLFVAQMEEELGEAIPYWDWTEDTTIPDLWDGITAPIQEGAVSACGGGQSVTKDPVNQLDFDFLKTETRDAFTTNEFGPFTDALMEPHNDFHNRFGCDMKDLATAAYHPLFYLHHSYVDYQWAYWQELQKLQGRSDPTIPGFDQPLNPFENSHFNTIDKTLRNNRAQDTFNYKENLCYEYDNLKFDKRTPQEFLDSLAQAAATAGATPNVGFRSSHTKIEDGHCRQVQTKVHGKNFSEEICSSGEKKLAKVSVAIALPRHAPSGINTFELCQDGQCVEGGRVGTFGLGKSSSGNDYSQPPQIDKEKYWASEVDVTQVVEKQGWSLKKPFEAKMTKTTISNIPKPLVVVKYLDDKGETEKKEVVSLKEKPQKYGNLLDQYSINNRRS